MYLLLNQALLVFTVLSLTNCKKKEKEEALWDCTYTLANVQASNKFSLLNQNLIDQDLREISGLAVGRKNQNLLYFVEDQGNPNEVQVIDTDGVFKTKLVLQGVQNIDWEDIAIGPGPVDGETYIYVADMGDNDAVRSSVRILRFIEPDLSANTSSSVVISSVDVINFQYASGAKDAETLMINPQTKDLIIITKRDELARVYLLAYPYDQSMNKPTFVGLLPFVKLVAGDISSDGQRILVKTKSTMYYWEVAENNLIKTMFQQAPKTVNYVQEPQGESVGFSLDGKKYFTMSETKGISGAQPILYQYQED